MSEEDKKMLSARLYRRQKFGESSPGNWVYSEIKSLQTDFAPPVSPYDHLPVEESYNTPITSYGETAVVAETAPEVDYEVAETAPEVDYEKEEKQRMEHLGELGAVAAGVYALYEKHNAGKDPEHAHRHKLEEEIAATAAVGAGGYAFHEHHKKKEAKEEDAEAH